ncbi:MAG: hypothetical protein COA52_12090 [Hyphomicrobiales bacterium]|nr:MAG: hypothetical protein COA52_12090 [Hyphomicrobiales bacterium]
MAAASYPQTSTFPRFPARLKPLRFVMPRLDLGIQLARMVGCRVAEYQRSNTVALDTKIKSWHDGWDERQWELD